MSAIPTRNPAGACVGRSHELSVLTGVFDEARHHGERLVLVRGPSGVGKSRLMAELRGRMRLEGHVVLEGRCTTGARALAPLAEVLRGALRFLEEVGREGDVDLAPLAFLLGDEAAIGTSGAGASRLEQRVRMFEAYCGLLRTLSRIRPPVLLFHDLDRADPATIELVAHLLDGNGPWRDSPAGGRTLLGLVVASVREDGLPPGLERLATHPKTTVLDLEGFDAEALREFLQDPTVVGRLLATTGGNPAELLALLDAPAGGADSAVRRLMEGLGPGARALMSALAVLGRPSEAGLVARVAGVESAARALSELVDSGLVVKSIRDGEILLRPARHHYSELVYGWLDQDARRAVHRRAAALLDGAVGLDAQDLAAHAIRAEEADLAVRAALEAATALELTCAYETATRLLEEARALASTCQRAGLSERLAGLLTHTGDYGRALVHAQQVLDARPGDPAARLAVGRLQSLAGDYDGAARTLKPLGDTEDPELAAEVAATVAEVRFWQGDYEGAIAACHGREGLSVPVALALENLLGKIDLARGDHASAGRIFEANLAAARAAGLEREQAHALINLGIVRLRGHDHGQARAALEEALELARRLGALRESAVALENLAVIAHFARDYGTALTCYHAAVADLKRLGNRSLLARAANNLGELYLRLGDADRAARMRELAFQMVGEGAPQAIVAEGRLLNGRIALACGRHDEARTELEACRALFASLGETARVAETLVTLARVDLADGDLSAARCRLAESLATGRGDGARRGEAALVESDLEAAAFGDALRPALVAADCFESIGDSEGAWRAHVRAASLLAEAGDDEGLRRHLGRAEALEARVRATVPAGFEAGLNADPDRQRLARARSLRDLGPGLGERREDPLPAAASPRPSDPPSHPEPRRLPVGPRTGIVHRSAAMAAVLEVAARAGASDSIVLIRGESGTGKELVADALHRASARSGRPFLKVNCGALVETLLLTELFGHEKGAFTGALQRRKGRFEAADGGTLFLDEIGDISPATQVSLLRVLQEQQFERVGGSTPIRTDVRIVCATNRDLEAMVREGRFREDLYYRLRGIQIFIPPLRERPEDIDALAEHFLEREARDRGDPPRRLGGDALLVLRQHPWPGNVRELENVVRTVALFVDGPAITAADLEQHAGLARPVQPSPAASSAPRESPSERPAPIDGVLDEVLGGTVSLADMKKRVERGCIEAALDRTGGNITRAAELLGMKRPRLSQLVKEHGLTRQDDKGQRAVRS